MQAHVRTHAHTQTCTNIATNTYAGTVFICASTPSCLLSRPVSHTLRSTKTSFESIYPSVLSLSLCLCWFLLLSSPPSLPLPLPLHLWRIWLKSQSVACRLCIYSAVTHFLSIRDGFKETREKGGVSVCLCVYGMREKVTDRRAERDRETDEETDRHQTDRHQ